MPVTANHYAHSLPDRPFAEWQRLEEHLTQVADLADCFASPFAPGWGRIVGLWHDAGKYRQAFQDMIGTDPDAHVTGKVDHSSVGALIARERKAPLLAFAVAGHHGGMPNADDLGGRLGEKAELLPEARRDGLPPRIEEELVPRRPDWLTDKVQLSLWTRFLFSALVDVDFLDTEKFYAGGIERNLGSQPSMAELKILLDQYIACKAAASDTTPMNQMRARVLEACRIKAGFNPGAFTLTVPTGGGKTLRLPCVCARSRAQTWAAASDCSDSVYEHYRTNGVSVP